MSEKRATRAFMTAEALRALDTVLKARPLVEALKDAKSDHPWTQEECDLLARLCVIFGVKA